MPSVFALRGLLRNDGRTFPRAERAHVRETRARVVAARQRLARAHELLVAEPVAQHDVLPPVAEVEVRVERPRRAVLVLATGGALGLRERHVRRHAAELAHLVVVLHLDVQTAERPERLAVVRRGHEHVLRRTGNRADAHLRLRQTGLRARATAFRVSP